MNMRVLKKSRKAPKPGDVFVFQVRDGEHTLRPVTQELDWSRQRQVFQRILGAHAQGAESSACTGKS